MFYLIYKATSPSGKVYIGMTKKTIDERRKEHEWHTNSNSNKIFHRAMHKYGCNFIWETLETGLSKVEAELKEIEYIAKFHATSRNFGYNQAKGGMAGDIMSEESRNRWRVSMEKYYSNPEWVKNITAHLNTDGFNQWVKSDSKDVRKWKSDCSNRLKKLANDRDSKLKRAAKKGGKPFICIETGEIFELLQDAADKFKVDKRRIHCVLKYPTRYKTISKKYTFKYV
jgi:hypothetical protein